MSMTIQNQPADHLFLAAISLPDSGQSINVSGAINPGSYLGVEIAFTNTSLSAPAPPGTGIINWLIEVNTTTAALDILQNTTPGAFPVNNAGCITIFQQTLLPSSIDEALVVTSITPDV